MSAEAREISIGAVVVSVLLTIMIFVYGGQDDFSEDGGIRISASFNRVDGLAVGDPVYLSGVRIGSVEKMWLNKNFRAIVSFQLKDGLVIPEDSSAAIHTDGLFGSKFIVVEPGGAEQAMKEGHTITFTQDAVIVSNLLDLIISEGKANRAKGKAKVTQ
tara:strand:+ start:12377 stop:12853 length:477 start_codon:yes stop_codon:yes gene_type:complete